MKHYTSGQCVPLKLTLPEETQSFARQFVSPERSPHISLVFGSGSEASRTPPISFWKRLIGELLAEYMHGEIILIGALAKTGTITEGVTRDWIEEMIAISPQVRDAFDMGLLTQLAVAEQCDLHISPHTGMSFAVQCLGVPWLVLSGGECAENIVNGVPFTSVYPSCERYPCGQWFAPQRNPMLPECEERRRLGQPFLCLSEERLMEKLPHILADARALIAEERPYLECVREHYLAMLPRLGKQEGDYFLDGWPDVLSETYIWR